MWRQAGISLPVRQQLLRLAECGWLHNKVRRYADARSSERAFGLVGQVGRAHARTRMHAHARACTRRQAETDVHTVRTRGQTQAGKRGHAHSACSHCMHSPACMHAFEYRLAHVHIQTYGRIHARTHTVTHTHAHMHAPTRTHVRICLANLSIGFCGVHVCGVCTKGMICFSPPLPSSTIVF